MVNCPPSVIRNDIALHSHIYAWEETGSGDEWGRGISSRLHYQVRSFSIQVGLDQATQNLGGIWIKSKTNFFMSIVLYMVTSKSLSLWQDVQ